MALKEQMDMFDDGGLMQEGGTIDPISGNDVPIGSTQEEVRDDIPAQLSEGEFVFPADVVRYYGLETLMKMRQEAKRGLKLMEAMGQMGNSEEATIPDDIPFDINDLDMEDDGVVEYQIGGFVPGQQYGISGYQPSQFAGFQQPTMTPQPMQPLQPTSMQPLQPTGMRPLQTSGTPISTTKVGGLPGQVGMGFDVGPPDEYKTYRNEAGQEIQVPFKDGKVHPAFTVPQGYTLATGPAETKTEETKVETTQTQEQSDSDDSDSVQIDPVRQGDKGQFTTTDMRGVGYDRSKIDKESGLLGELNEIIKAQSRDIGPFVAGAFGAGIGPTLKEAGTRIASELGVGKFKETKGVNSRREFLTSQKVTMDAILSGLNATYGGTRSAFQKGQGTAGQRLHELAPEVQRSLAGELKANREALAQALEGKTAADLRAEINNTQEGLGKDLVDLGIEKTYTATQRGRQVQREKTYGQLFAEARATKAARDKLANQYGFDAKGMSISEARAKAAEVQKQREAVTRAGQERLAGDFYDEGDEGPTLSGSPYGESAFDPGSGYDFDVDDDDAYMAKGGLAQQMKQSGLASKK
tara:strand:- start:6195 stop:7937 length:1743 start_codon:yes stop_codon:yes gene_type:complete